MLKILYGITVIGALVNCSIVAAPEAKVKHAIAPLNPTKGNRAFGKVTFTQVEGGVQIVAEMENLEPGRHALIIHEWGDVSAPDAASAGGHFNPRSTKHGAPDAHERHVGDLGNIAADDKGRAHYERVDKMIKLDGTNTIIGRSVIVHANADDYKTQPTGNVGGAIAAGVIE